MIFHESLLSLRYAKVQILRSFQTFQYVMPVYWAGE